MLHNSANRRQDQEKDSSKGQLQRQEKEIACHPPAGGSLHVSALKVQAGTNRPISAKNRRLADDKRHLPE